MAASAASSPAGVSSSRDSFQSVFHSLADYRDSLSQSAARLAEEVRALRLQMVSLDAVRAQLEREQADLEFAAGLQAAEGPGLRVTLTDNPEVRELPGLENPGVVHDYDLRAVVNALWRGGAEAVAINTCRVGPMVSIRCVGATVLVGARRTASPFIVEAIGDPDSLESAFRADRETALLVQLDALRLGLHVHLERVNKLSLPGYAENQEVIPRHLQQAKETV